MQTAAMLCAVAGLAAAGMAAQANPTAILQSTGFGDNAFADGAAQQIQFDRFDRPNKSGDGSYWVMLARNTGGSAVDSMVITGQGASYNLAALEGTTEYEPGRFFSTSDRYMDINASGDWAAIGNLAGGATDDDEVIYRGNFDGTVNFLGLREGQPIGASGFSAGTANYGPSITDAGQVSAVWDTLNTPTANDIVYFAPNGAVVLQEGVSVPGGQRGGTAFTLASPFGGRNATQFDSAGASYVTIADLSNGDQVLIKDGGVVLQEGDDFGGKILSQIRGEQNILEDNGDWLTRVRFDDGTGGAIKNGQLIAQSGDLVGGSVPGERWSEIPWTSSSDTTFALVAGDTAGNIVLGGFTDNPDPSANFVWTYNGAEILRAGDQVDVDGDGSLDDAFIFTSSFSTASPQALGGFLADDGFLYTNVDLRNGAGDTLGTAFIRVLVPTPATGALLALAGLTAARRRR